MDPDEIREKPQALLDIKDRYDINLKHDTDKEKECISNLIYVKTEDDISSDKSTVK